MSKGTQYSLYWHDYETSGVDPRRDRPMQFAGLRTDLELNPVGDPLVLYCQLAADVLPAPDACLLTGITPQRCNSQGVVEADFIARIHQELALPGTCGVGYNSIRFDDEITRNTLYRNFFDPYAREWQNANSRWDIIDLLRMTRALRPEGIAWPDHEDGRPSFRLEHLTAANGISHEAAHDALSDVTATLAMARLVKDRQPRLYEYLFALRNKHKALELLNPLNAQPLVHVSGMLGAEHQYLAVILPLMVHPVNRNEVICANLLYPPDDILNLDSDALRERLYTPTDQLAPGTERIPLKGVHANKSPAIAPLATLRAEDAERLHIDLELCMQHGRQLAQDEGLPDKLAAVYEKGRDWAEERDPDLMIYSGGFFSREDRAQMDRLRQTPAEELVHKGFSFVDPRLDEMLFRYRARNWPHTLTGEEQSLWLDFRRKRLCEGEAPAIQGYRQRIAELQGRYEANSEQARLLEELLAYATSICIK